MLRALSSVLLKYTWKNSREGLAELQGNSELHLLKISPEVYLAKNSIMQEWAELWQFLEEKFYELWSSFEIYSTDQTTYRNPNSKTE